ncbi:hypothetical protein [Arsenicibacter rosenii]|uniref:Uncharacterized protein n=1 Tax=Arsenicibacter rosenii TaxID=1750698 RepID=A0A1S2VDR3_9BACT|nr:hypothetical protein [Arsenicibacter rosenii]OIN56864.1 hypothetical protein BLX24_23115 [Arsenicibacter rosenii]
MKPQNRKRTILHTLRGAGIRSLVLFCTFAFAFSGAQAQAVYAGEQAVEKVNLQGYFLTITADSKQLEKEWEAQLRTFGRVNTARGVYRVTNADIPSVSTDPLNLTSQLKSSRGSSTLFVAFDLGSGNFIKPGNGNSAAAEQLLKDFAAQVQYNQEVRTAETALDDAQKNHQKMVRNGERLQRDLDRNKKEKETLLRRIDENAKELDQLLKDTETNKTDQSNALTEMENKKKALEVVKTKKN